MDAKELKLDLETVEQVADMLWLSSYIEKSKVEEVELNESKPNDETIKDNKNPEKIKKPIKKRKEEPLPKEGKKEASVYDNDACNSKTDIKADPIRMPKKLSLSHYRAWEKSFKSFYYKVDSTREFVLDETKTVDIIAKTKLVQPIFKAKKVKYFHLVMVIEQSPSMDIWSELLLEFQKTIQRFGVFESITFYYLASDKQGVKLYTDRALKRELSPKKITLNRQILLTVVSDCVSPAWHSNHIFKMLEFWSKSVPVSITQMFPKRMWQGTSLYKGFQTSFTAHDFQLLNKQLKSDDDYYDEEDETFNIPIVNFEPQSVTAWASVIHGKKDKWIDGVTLEDLGEQQYVEMAENKERISVDERVKRYLSQASPMAQKLALYASVLPINFHVIRVLQELKLPESSQIHLAEFFLGGLIKRNLNEKKHVSFDFYDGVRDYFRNQLTATASYRLQELMSNFVSQNLNSSLDFQALIDNPNSTSGLFLSKNEVAFAKLRAETLLKLGGDYGRRGERLLDKLALGEEKTLNKDIKREFLKDFMPLSKLVKKEIDNYSYMFNYSFELSGRLARSFSEKHSSEVIKEVMGDIVKVYGNIGWIKKLEKNRILWVDDIPKNNKKTKDKFENIGLKVDLALSTDEALELVDKNSYLVVISDVGRAEGKQEGYVLLDKFRALDKETPFIFFAANSDSLKNRKLTLERGGQGSTNDHIRLCRMVMNVIEDGRVEEYVVNPSVVLIQSKINKNFGTGFSIYQDKGGSYILTATQIFRGLSLEEIKIEGFEVNIYSMGSTEVSDLAILYVKGLFVPSLVLETNSLESREVYTVGYNVSQNEEHRQNRVDGKILGDKVLIVSREGVSNNLNLWKMLSSFEGIKLGCSGAPLISKESGKVIGLISHREGSKKLYAISIDFLKTRIDEKSILPFQNLTSFELRDSNLYFAKQEKADSVVLIKSNDNSNLGTGFVIFQDNGGSYVVTTEHIVDYTINAMVNGYENVEIINVDKRLNLAILYVQGFYVKALELQDKDFANREVELLGYSRFTNLENKKEIMEAKIVSNFSNITNDEGSIYSVWKIIAYNGYGFDRASSGTPLLSKESGKVIGVFSAKEGQNMGYAISIQYLQELIIDKRLSAFKKLKFFGLEVDSFYFNKGHMSKSIVFISNKDRDSKSFGTGFVVYQDKGGSYVVTANDVIESTVEPIINYKYNVEVIRTSKMFQLAILYVKDFYEEPFSLEDENFVSREVEMMGYSTFKKGQYRKEAIEGKIISDSLIVTDGKSKSYKGWEIISADETKFELGGGSPVVSKESGKVVGVFTSRKRSTTLGYAISIEHLKDVWNDK